jgi:hypothetical protein
MDVRSRRPHAYERLSGATQRPATSKWPFPKRLCVIGEVVDDDASRGRLNRDTCCDNLIQRRISTGRTQSQMLGQNVIMTHETASGHAASAAGTY